MRRKLIIALLLALFCAFPIFAQRTASNPLGAQLNVQDAGTCSTTNSFAWQVLPANAATTIVNLSGTFSGTLTIRLSTNGGGSWTTNSTTTTAGNTSVATNGFTDICADVTTFTSGIFQVSISTGLNTGPQGPAGAGAAPPNSPLPSATSGPGPVFNVKNYGAKGNMKNSINASINGSTITCPDCNFTQADVNTPSFFSRVYATVWSNLLITSVTNATTASIAPNSFAANSGTLSWGGAIDDTAVSNALTAAVAAAQQQFEGGALAVPAGAPILYFPAGNYGLLNTQMLINPASSRAGLAIKGDGAYQSRITALTGYVPTRLLVIANMSSVTVQGLTFDGMTGSGASQFAIDTSSGTTFNDVVIQNFNNGGIRVASTNLYMGGFLIAGNNGTGFTCSPCSGQVENGVFTNNNNANVIITNATGLPGDFGIKFGVGVRMDECSAPPCMQINNSQDVWLVGSSFFGTAASSGIQVDGTSYVHINGGLVGPFAQDNNGTAVTILTGGVVEANDVRFVSTGTGKCINNSGTFINNGANTCEAMFNQITAAASAGTTATLTVTTQGANVSAECAVNDSVYVQNVGVAGYNGFFKNKVTAVGANTLSYTTPGSNLGASSGGTVFCRSYNNYSGTLPYSTLTPTPNTCYVTGTFAAITLCNQFIDRAINIYHIKASSSTTTACTVAPVVTISDGTNSATLTITTAKASWDSSVDTSTNVGTLIFTPDGGTLTVSTTAGTCTTPPTNFALTYTMQGVMDN